MQNYYILLIIKKQWQNACDLNRPIRDLTPLDLVRSTYTHGRFRPSLVRENPTCSLKMYNIIYEISELKILISAKQKYTM